MREKERVNYMIKVRLLDVFKYAIHSPEPLPRIISKEQKN